jgi:hypothetical protein
MTQPRVEPQPIRLDCPIACLRFTPHIARVLERHREAPITVSDLLDLVSTGALTDMKGLGPRRVARIKAVLAQAGFDVHTPGHLHDPADPHGHDFRPR